MTEDLEAKFLDTIETFGRDVLESHPGLQEVLARFWAGEIDTTKAIREVWRLAAASTDTASDLQRAMFDAFGVQQTAAGLDQFPDRDRLLQRWGFEEEDLIFVPDEERPDYKMLHPLLMGMIVELLQFDGDVPELRTGKMPEGGTPAVPVRTMARDPVVVGAMLRTASREVALELAEARKSHDQKMAQLVEAVGEASPSALVRQETERGVAVPGYAPGSKAAVREVRAPHGLEVARMPFKERQELAHKALTSTQGRRSAVPVISGMILDALHAHGFAGLRLVAEEGETVFADVEWTVMIDGGQTERNPNFSFIDTASRSLTAKLKKQLSGEASRYTSMFLLVTPVNAISERRVGWQARLYEKAPS